MPVEEQLRIWSAMVAVASVTSLAVPLVVAMRRRGGLVRKGLLIAGAFAASWGIAILLLIAVVVPALVFEEPLAQKVLSDAHALAIWSYLSVGAQAVGQYWYFVGQIGVPVAAALASLPVSVLLSRRFLPVVQAIQRAA